jgi:hypothetical protein
VAVVKQPAWFTAELGDTGRRVVAQVITRDAAAAHLAELAFRRENRPFLQSIVHTWMLAKVRAWADSYLGSMTADQIKAATGALPLPCMDLPALLEVRPGRFVHQGALTREDLKAAVVQAETKASNATGYAEKVKRLAAAAIPLMANDETTLAEVAPRLPALRGSGVPERAA